MNRLLIEKYSQFLLPVVIFILTLFFSYNLVQNFDMWFHIKSGEIILEKGIIHHDVFSFATPQREWVPYEWLFQSAIFLFTKFFGLFSIKYLLSILAATTITTLYMVIKRIFSTNFAIGLIASLLFFTGNFAFFTLRPQSVAIIFLLINLGLILLYILKNKNLLLLTIPITLIWANLHASVVLDVVFFLSYALISIINYFLLKEKQWLAKTKVLSIFTIITFILTVLPPLFFTQYQFLLKIYTHREIISSFISEWQPLTSFPTEFFIYTITLICVSIIFIYSIFKDKQLKHNLFLLPFIVMPFLGFSSSRNVFYGYLAFSFILGWSLSKINFQKSLVHIKSFVIIFLSLILITQVYYFYLQAKPIRYYYPKAAANFIKNMDLKGNMFNEYPYGGYLLYSLYPKQKVFIDGRTDVYLCCEVLDLLNLYNKAGLDDKSYKNILNKLWDKYVISFVLIKTKQNTYSEKISNILQNDSNWSLVFWDDNSQIFVRDNGKNSDVINKFGAEFATPYGKTPFASESAKSAFIEYQEMIKIADSARSRNAIGLILSQQKEYGKAQKEFEKAIELDQSFESPYMNLAEIEIIQNKNYDLALKLYKDALSISPDRPFIYLRLGQLYIEGFNDRKNALSIWKKGLEQFSNIQTRETFDKYIKKYR